MEKQFEGFVSKSDIKILCENNTLYFPLAVEYADLNEYGGDARSFGYNYDEGKCTVVTYEAALGVLADDTLALVKQQSMKPKPPSVGVYAIEMFNHNEDVLNEWKADLDDSWAEREYEEWRKKGLIDANETKAGWIAEQLDNYHCWPIEWKEKHDQHLLTLNAPIGELSHILSNGELTLYIDTEGFYFFKTKYFNHGKLQKADEDSALEYIDLYHIYCEQVKAHNALTTVVNTNLNELKKVFGAPL